MKLVDFAFGHPGGQSVHHTYSSRAEGSWIVFVCPECPGHERRVNWQTGRMVSQGVTHATHSGFHSPSRADMH